MFLIKLGVVKLQINFVIKRNDHYITFNYIQAIKQKQPYEQIYLIHFNF